MILSRHDLKGAFLFSSCSGFLEDHAWIVLFSLDPSSAIDIIFLLFELLLQQFVSGKKNVERATGIFVRHCGQSHPHTIGAQQMMSLLESVEASP